MVIEDHEVLASVTVGDRETASLVSGYFSSQFNCFNKHLMGSGWGRMIDRDDALLRDAEDKNLCTVVY